MLSTALWPDESAGVMQTVLLCRESWRVNIDEIDLPENHPFAVKKPVRPPMVPRAGAAHLSSQLSPALCVCHKCDLPAWPVRTLKLGNQGGRSRLCGVRTWWVRRSARRRKSSCGSA